MKQSLIGLLVGVLVTTATCVAITPAADQTKGDGAVRLGNFSVILAVKDLAASRAFYEKLGFRAVAGTAAGCGS